jgi:vacuolar-type H+-ATPase subunit H
MGTAMDETQSKDAADTVFRALRDGDAAHDGDTPADRRYRSNGSADLGTPPPSGDDLVEHLRQQAQALIDDADKLASSWLEEAEVVREEALNLRRNAEVEVAAAREEAQLERDALLEEARDRTRDEAARILQEAQAAAADVLQEATEEGRFHAKAEADELLRQTEQIAAEIVQQATAEAVRIVADAHREEARVLLDARARVDEVRGRLIRLYQEMEAATTARWGAGSMASRELSQGTHTGHGTDDS